MQDKQVEIKLSVTDINRIITLLMSLKYSQVYDLIETLRTQTLTQIR
jgi:hypothetical protein